MADFAVFSFFRDELLHNLNFIVPVSLQFIKAGLLSFGRLLVRDDAIVIRSDAPGDCDTGLTHAQIVT